MKTIYQLFRDGVEVQDWWDGNAILFKPKWYRIDRWLWWFFICGGPFSKYEWSLFDSNGAPMRAYIRK